MSKAIEIQWHRLIENGKTCPRCSETEKELEEAVKIARMLLSPKGIVVKLSKGEISIDEFIKNPLVSNQILINGIPIEEVLNAGTGKSPCCDVCGPVECRTMEIGNNIYETIPKELIISAIINTAKSL
ncbi:MAG: DUF2703 domain-containing protein [Candidatus Hydrogenedentes bacterium]|nr:DUF2703 domain-containing protein [Candidatus Hydrogenedentota bacterium]